MKRLFILLCVTLVQTISYAEENFSAYEDIVRELKSSETQSIRSSIDRENSIPIRIHGDIGFVTSRLNLDLPKTYSQSQGLQGTEVVLGIDLFSPTWRAEGALRSFRTEKFSSGNISLREFDLRVVREAKVSPAIDFRVGGGMSARYLKLTNLPAEDGLILDNSTPASLFLLGLKGSFSPTIALSVDLTFKNRLVNETIDRGSIDGAVRVSGSF